ncbi:MAG: AraC family transcriptional regulator [Nitriliruptoraceae bacterium]|nr:AraC family transcriptional regulator [Nitriliruptoraceae bacterium]
MDRNETLRPGPTAHAHGTSTPRHDPPALTLIQPDYVLAGFHAEFDPAATPLLHAGEQWAATRSFVEEHAHPCWELYLQAHGRSCWRVRETVIELTPGHALAVAPREPHAMVERPRARHHYLYAAFDLAAVADTEVVASFTTASHHHLERGASLLGSFRLLVQEALSAAGSTTNAVDAAARLVAVEFHRLITSAARGTSPRMHPAVVGARQLLDDRFSEAWTVPQLAEVVGLSPNHFSQVFRRDVGQTPHRYLMDRRLERARELLVQSQLGISELAAQLGFASGSHLARSFRAAEGMSPSEFRRAAS